MSRPNFLNSKPMQAGAAFLALSLLVNVGCADDKKKSRETTINRNITPANRFPDPRLKQIQGGNTAINPASSQGQQQPGSQGSPNPISSPTDINAQKEASGQIGRILDSQKQGSPVTSLDFGKYKLVSVTSHLKSMINKGWAEGISVSQFTGNSLVPDPQYPKTSYGSMAVNPDTGLEIEIPVEFLKDPNTNPSMRFERRYYSSTVLKFILEQNGNNLDMNVIPLGKGDQMPNAPFALIELMGDKSAQNVQLNISKGTDNTYRFHLAIEEKKDEVYRNIVLTYKFEPQSDKTKQSSSSSEQPIQSTATDSKGGGDKTAKAVGDSEDDAA